MVMSIYKSKKIDKKIFSDVINRIKDTCGFNKDQEVAEFIGISNKNFSAYKSRNVIPVEKIEIACLKKGIDFHKIMEETPAYGKSGTQFADNLPRGVNAVDAHQYLMLGWWISERLSGGDMLRLFEELEKNFEKSKAEISLDFHAFQNAKQKYLK